MNGNEFGTNLESRFLPGGGPPNSFSRSSNIFMFVVPFGKGDVDLALCLTNTKLAEQHGCSFTMVIDETTGKSLP